MSEPIQPESTERCAVGPGRVCTCSDADGVKWSGVCPAHYWRMYGCCTCDEPLAANGWPAGWQHAADCKGVTLPKKARDSEIGPLRRALAEAETLKRISDSQAHEAWIERDGALARLAEAEKERDIAKADAEHWLEQMKAANERANGQAAMLTATEKERDTLRGDVLFVHRRVEEMTTDRDALAARLTVAEQEKTELRLSYEQECRMYDEACTAFRAAEERAASAEHDAGTWRLAHRSAEERAAQAERRLFENGHAILTGDASCCDACDRAVLGRAEPRAAAPEALSDSGGGAQGEEK